MKKEYFALRLLILAILWVGLGILLLQGKIDNTLVWQGVVFSVLIVIGYFIEYLVGYKGDPYILPVVLALMALGLVFLSRIKPASALRQFWWASIGLFVFYLILIILRDYKILGQYRYLHGIAAVGLLFLTLVFGVATNGATSWLELGGIRFEPEEFVKIVMLVFLASFLSENEELLRIGTVQVGKFSLPDWRTFGPFLVIGSFSLGLLAAQKSLGTALVFYSVFILMLYLVTERLLYLAVSIPMLFLTGSLGYFLFGHVRLRVAMWLNPWADTTGGGYQIAQSLFSIAGGQILGTGLGNGIGAFQVPASSTDFVFSVIAEELGFGGAMAVLCLFLILVMRAFVVSLKAQDKFGQILAAGIGILLGTETLIILAGVTKLLPLTGIPLPWVSYGGSSLLVHFILLGILSNISNSSAAGTLNLKTKRREYTA